MKENKEFIENIFYNIEKILSTKIIYGESLNFNKTTIIPISKANFNFGIGNVENIDNKKDIIGNGFYSNVKIEPIGFLIITEFKIEILNINDSNIEILSKKAIDLINLLKNKKCNKNNDE